MPRRAIFLSVVACLCLAPAAALAAPVTKRDATPNAAGSQVDTAVAITPSGKRLMVATDADDPKVRVWKRAVDAGGDVTWSNAVAGTGVQPSIAWDGDSLLKPGGAATAYVAMATPATCASATSSVPITMREYHPSSGFGTTTTLLPFAGKGIQSWPQVVLNTSTDPAHVGEPITVTDELECAPGPDAGKHRVLVGWPGALRLVGFGRLPDVAVLPAVAGEETGTRIAVAYLSEPSGGQQDVMLSVCTVSGTFNLVCADPEVVDGNIEPPVTVTAGGFAVTPVAAPSIACDANICNVAWTEGAGSPGAQGCISRARQRRSRPGTTPRASRSRRRSGPAPPR